MHWHVVVAMANKNTLATNTSRCTCLHTDMWRGTVSGVLPSEEAFRSLVFGPGRPGPISVTKLQPLRVTLMAGSVTLSDHQGHKKITVGPMKSHGREKTARGPSIHRRRRPCSFVHSLDGYAPASQNFSVTFSVPFLVSHRLISSNIVVEFIPAASFLATVIN
jgi:hypothetical protein